MAEPRDWLTLLRAPGVGPATCGKLLSHFGSVDAVLRADRPTLESVRLKNAAIDWLKQPDEAVLSQDLAWLDEPEHHLITLDDPAYPPLLGGIADPPPVLFVTGDADMLIRPQLAVVGSRNPSGAGARNARDFARYLAGAGITITSGLAIGIDAAAHDGALATGHTVAVGGTGPDRIYPARNRDLAHRIAEQGALVTEFPPGTGVRREHFPRRNRIISGLSLGTLVVEAAARSGSLITARVATEQGREVFAIPGSIHNPLSRGCHALIRQGAKLVETAQDVIEELAPLLGNLESSLCQTDAENPTDSLTADPEYQALLVCLSHDPVAPDTLTQCSGLTADVVSSMLLMLELEGVVEAVPGGRYSLIGKA